MGGSSSKLAEQEQKVQAEQEQKVQAEQEQKVQDLIQIIKKRCSKLSPHSQNLPLRILLCGSVRAGKSSLINNMLSAVKGYLVHTAPVGNAHGHVTEKYTEYKIRVEDNSANEMISKIVVGDSMGFDINKPEDHVGAVRAVLDGYYNPNQSMTDMQSFHETISKKRQASYIIFVVDATQMENVKDDRSQMMESLQMFAQKERILVCVFLTFCDLLDGDVSHDMENIYKSAKVERVINLAHQQFNGIPKGRIYPIVNYTDQRNVEPQMRLLPLRALYDIICDLESNMNDIVT